MRTTGPKIFPEIEKFVSSLNGDTISEERKLILQPLIDFIQLKAENRQAIRINFICTHNSRRSHLSQVWAQALAYCFEVKNVSCFSGGTEATAVYPMVAETLKDSGFKVKQISEGSNPVYSIKYAKNEQPLIAFSKKYDDSFNPESEFAAVLTCSEADGACPFIAGAEKRIPVTFEDPKAYDGTPLQAEKYRERSLQIATDLFFVFSQIKP